MEFTSFEAIMDFAIEKEKEAAGFYDDLGAQEAFAGARKTFADFAAEERRHRDMLEHFTTDNIERYKIQKIPNLKRSDYLVDLAYEPGMSYSDILILATKREEKALKFSLGFQREGDCGRTQEALSDPGAGRGRNTN